MSLLALMALAGLSAPVPRITVFYAGELRGMLSPCGCTAGMLGGLARRAGYLRKHAGPSIVVENGDLVAGAGRQDEIKAEAIADSLAAMRCEAVGLGETDLRLGTAYLDSLQARLRGAIVCANARKPDGSAAFGEWRSVVRTAAGKPVRAAIVGLISPALAVQTAPPDLRFEDSARALARLSPAIRKADMRILLYHGPSSEARAIVRRAPWFQIVVCAHEGDSPMLPVRESGALFVAAGEKGKRLGRADLTAAPWRAVNEGSIALGAAIPNDPTVEAIRRGYNDRVAGEALLAAVPRLPIPGGDAYAGSQACAPCHAAAHTSWTSSRHSRALQTLRKAGQDRDPECAPCHVVGLDRIGGFTADPPTPALASVGCEACHGAAAKYAAGAGPAPAKVGAASCQPCHVPEHSPGFQFEAYWAKVQH